MVEHKKGLRQREGGRKGPKLYMMKTTSYHKRAASATTYTMLHEKSYSFGVSRPARLTIHLSVSAQFGDPGGIRLKVRNQKDCRIVNGPENKIKKRNEIGVNKKEMI